MRIHLLSSNLLEPLPNISSKCHRWECSHQCRCHSHHNRLLNWLLHHHKLFLQRFHLLIPIWSMARLLISSQERPNCKESKVKQKSSNKELKLQSSRLKKLSYLWLQLKRRWRLNLLFRLLPSLQHRLLLRLPLQPLAIWMAQLPRLLQYSMTLKKKWKQEVWRKTLKTSRMMRRKRLRLTVRATRLQLWFQLQPHPVWLHQLHAKVLQLSAHLLAKLHLHLHQHHLHQLHAQQLALLIQLPQTAQLLALPIQFQHQYQLKLFAQFHVHLQIHALKCLANHLLTAWPNLKNSSPAT